MYTPRCDICQVFFSIFLSISIYHLLYRLKHLEIKCVLCEKTLLVRLSWGIIIAYLLHQGVAFKPIRNKKSSVSRRCFEDANGGSLSIYQRRDERARSSQGEKQERKQIIFLTTESRGHGERERCE